MSQNENAPVEFDVIVEKLDSLFLAAMDKFFIDDDREKYFSGFTHEEMVTTVVAMTLVIPSDGMHGWLERNSGMLFSETCQVLKEIGAVEYFRIFVEFGEFLDSINQPRSSNADIYALLQNQSVETLGDIEERFCVALKDKERSLYTLYLEWYCKLVTKPFAHIITIDC